jgi:hypothetical protein
MVQIRVRPSPSSLVAVVAIPAFTFDLLFGRALSCTCLACLSSRLKEVEGLLFLENNLICVPAKVGTQDQGKGSLTTISSDPGTDVSYLGQIITLRMSH